MKPKITYFTTQTAKGNTFCNRDQERLHIKRNITKGKHTVITAPRRYGKTSLVCQVLSEIKVNYAEIDLFCAVSSKAVCNKIVQGVSALVTEIVPFTEKALRIVTECFKNTHVGIKAGNIEIKVEFSRLAFNPVDEITKVLQGLENIAQKQQKRVVLFIDEFQDLVKVDQSHEIQAAIRSVAQKAKYVMFIFSGSSRHMLKKIFDDRNQPLYMLCDKMYLNRIKEIHFQKHIQQAAKKKWRRNITDTILKSIFSVTELHPYYVNLLCDTLWDEDKTPATVQTIEKAWDECLLTQKDKIIADLAPLNTNRMKVLNGFALLDEVKEPNSKDFLNTVDLSLGSAQKSITYLFNHDYIYRTEMGTIKLIDPLLKKFIVEQIEYI